MKDIFESLAKDYLLLVLAGLGITFAPHEYIGGMFLGLAGAALAARLSPETNRIELWAVFLCGFLVSHAVATLPKAWLPGPPLQVWMMGAGFSSRFAARTALRVMGFVETKSERIADRAIDRVLSWFFPEAK